MTLPPGSIYKVLSSIALLEGAGLDPEQTFHCQGFLDNPDAYRCLVFRHYGVGHGAVNLVDALARSCNVYFFAAARRSGIATGARALHDWSLRMGFGQPTGIDVPGERSGTVPALGVGNPRKSVVAGETLQVAIGQGQLTVTPLQVARLMAAVANGGQLVTPHLVEGEGPAVILASATDGTGLDEGISAPPPQPIPGLSRRTLEWVRAGLRQVIAHPQGTGYKTVRLPDVAIAGKTGTAESGGGRPDHAWFAGYVPAEAPRVAFVVVLEHAGSGGHAAGPVARDLVRAMLQTGIISRE
jgi:penicillin-binding protein 2